MTASSAAVVVSRPWMVRLLFVSAGALATVALSTGTAHADANLVGNVVKQAHSVVKSTHQTVHRTPAKAAAPVRHTVSTVTKTIRHVATPVQRVATQRTRSAARPATTVQHVAKTTATKRVVHRVPAKKVIHLAVKPLASGSLKTSAVQLSAVKPLVVQTAPLLTAINRDLLGPIVGSPLLDPVVTPVLQVVAPGLTALPAPLGPIVSAPLPVAAVPSAPLATGPTHSVVDTAPALSSESTPVLNGPTPNVSGVGSMFSRQGLATVAHITVAQAVDQVTDATGSIVLGSLGSLVVTLAVGAGATGTASAGSGGSPGTALLERGPLGAAATSNRRFGDGLRLAPWALAKHPGFAPD